MEDTARSSKPEPNLFNTEPEENKTSIPRLIDSNGPEPVPRGSLPPSLPHKLFSTDLTDNPESTPIITSTSTKNLDDPIENKLRPSGLGVTKSGNCGDSDSEFCIKPENAINSVNTKDTSFESLERARISIKSEILDEEDEDQDDIIGRGHGHPFFMDDQEEDEESRGSYDFAIGGNISKGRGCGSGGSSSVQDELKKCKGRLDAFGHELKLLCAELEIVTGWIDKHFGIKLINKESLLFKHIYDFEEIEQISEALSLLSQVGKPPLNPKGGAGTTGRRRGRPGRKSTEASVSSKSRKTQPQATPVPSTSGQKRGRRKKIVDNTLEVDLNPQDFLETIYDEKHESSQNQSRPKRATRRKINYKEEDKDLDISKIPIAKDSEDDFEEPDDVPIDDPGDSDFLNEDPEEKKPARSKRKRNTPRKKKNEDKTENHEEDGEEPEGDEDEEGSESQTDGNGESESAEPGKKKKRVRKRYPKKPGVVWNSSLPKQCDECGKVLKGTSTLKLHKMMHADERPHSCEICGNKFRFRRNLKVHMMALHTGERPLQCSFCGRKFYAPKDLRIHERTHTGEKPYPCSVCPKRFNVKEHLTMHMRVHTGERPYECSVCAKRFSQANSLRIHKKIHEREKEPTPRKPRKPKNPQQTLQNSNPLQQGPSSITNTNTNSNANTNTTPPTPSPQSLTPSLLSTHSSNTTSLQQQPHSSSLQTAAALLQQLNPHLSNMSSTSNTSSGHSSPIPAHMNSNISNLMSSDKLPFTSSNTVPQSSSSFSSVNSSAAMNFHQQAHNMHSPQNPFIVPLNTLNENWRMPFSSVGVDHQRFGSPSNSNASNSRNLGSRSDNFGGNSLNQSGSQLDPRFHSFYSQNQ